VVWPRVYSYLRQIESRLLRGQRRRASESPVEVGWGWVSAHFRFGGRERAKKGAYGRF
jgi:hypothetical protein